MKTTKAKKTSPSKTPAKSHRDVRRRMVASKTEPTEDEIRLKAQEIFNQRISSGEYGTAQDDWHKAEKILRGL